MKRTLRFIMLLVLTILLTVGMIVNVSVSAQEDDYLKLSGEDSEAVDVAENETESFLYEEILSEEQQLKENAAIEKYNKLLENWSYDKTNISDIDADFPEFYGGIYINDEKNLIIQVTDNNENVISYFEQLIDLTDVEFEEVKYSFDQLKEVHDRFEEYIHTSTKSQGSNTDISAVGMSMQDNSVTLYVVNTAIEEGLLYTELNITEDYLESDMLQIIQVSGPDEDASSALKLGSTLISSSGKRSVGFWAYDSDENLGIVTAGHGVSSGETFSVAGVTFGKAGTPYVKNAVDAVFIKCTSSSFEPSLTSVSNKIVIKSNMYAYLPTGATTYSYGYASGYKTGEVLDNFFSGSTESGAFTNMTLTSATCKAGDSGGVVAGASTSSVRYLAGIIKGYQNSTGYQIYSKVNYIIANLDVTVY